MGKAQITDCIFKVPERFRELAEELIRLFDKSVLVNQIQRSPKKEDKHKKEKGKE